MFLKKLQLAIAGILIEVGLALLVVGAAYLLCLFVSWVIK